LPCIDIRQRPPPPPPHTQCDTPPCVHPMPIVSHWGMVVPDPKHNPAARPLPAQPGMAPSSQDARPAGPQPLVLCNPYLVGCCLPSRPLCRYRDMSSNLKAYSNVNSLPPNLRHTMQVAGAGRGGGCLGAARETARTQPDLSPLVSDPNPLGDHLTPRPSPNTHRSTCGWPSPPRTPATSRCSPFTPPSSAAASCATCTWTPCARPTCCPAARAASWTPCWRPAGAHQLPVSLPSRLRAPAR
jgi:hypothetical protein